jgi:DNA-directed RNA polymerase, sigma subunit (sigma70/sigma32)
MPLSFVIRAFYITKGGWMQEKKLMQMFEKDVGRIPILTNNEELAIARQSLMGDEAARNRLVESNMRFVIKVVFQYWSHGLPLMDMISEGCLGLIKAAKTFDPDKGFRFLTYAGNSIVQGVIKAIKDHKQCEHDPLMNWPTGMNQK